MKRLLLATSVAMLALVNPITALSKKESKPDLNPIPGKVLDHKGIVINPTPVKITRPYSGMYNISAGLNLSNIPDDLTYVMTETPVSKDGIYTEALYGEELAQKNDVKPVSGAYRLYIGPHKISVIGYDKVGAAYGLTTLNQIVAGVIKNGQDLPMMEIEDYPALKNRGVVEGFYGEPWSHETRLSMLDFMGRNKMNCYVYGPKDDPYHRTPSWRQPYPEKEGKRIAELAERANKNNVRFVWAIHPGGDIRWDKADYDSLLNKFSAMYDLGVRQFAIFFDDIKGEGTDSHKQAKLLNDLVKDFVKQKDGVENLILCPTDYNQGWANPTENGQLAIYGRELDPAVDVFWTGKVVCGDIEPASMEFVDTRIKRPALVWWNFPVSDYCRHNLLMGPVYGLDTTLTGDAMVGLLSNPMENGEASKSAIYSVADYDWNPAAYNPLDSWTRSFEAIMPGAPEEYGTFAIHACDPPKNYRRNESWNVETFRYDNYTPQQYNALKNEFSKIKAAPDAMFTKGGNMPLVVEIAPWLVQFSNLGDRGLKALELIKIYESGDKVKFKEAYNRLKLLNDIQKPGYMDHRSGTLRLQPFIENVLTDLAPYYNN
ncbi:MAG: beta-N-acetylglucosaminidase domain-containing protein [Muribaculaceae bacterium]|nr:beta-N-acetylglucosaminidase domain-containing protein [Muribaculaceae bacterium]